MASSRNVRQPEQPAIDPQLRSQLVAKFGKRLLAEGFTALPTLIQRYYRLVPGNARYEYEYLYNPWMRRWERLEETKRLVSEVSFMTPTEFAIMCDVWSYWWRAESKPWPSEAEIARHLGKSRRQIQRYIQRMQDSGWLLTITQISYDGKQLTNRYDFTPFLRRLLELLDAIEQLEKPIQEGGEGVIFDSRRMSVLPKRGASETTSESHETVIYLPKGDESRLRRGADRAELEKGGESLSGAAIGNIEEDKTHKIRTAYENEQHEEPKPTPPLTTSSAAAKGANEDEKSKRKGLARRAEAMGVTLEAYDALNVWLEKCPKPAEDEDIWLRENMPELTSLRAVMSSHSRANGNLNSKISNQTHGLKLYKYACEHYGLPEYRFYDCICQAQLATDKKKQQGNLKAPMAYFFVTVKLHLLCAIACEGFDPQPPTPASHDAPGQELPAEDTCTGSEDSAETNALSSDSTDEALAWSPPEESQATEEPGAEESVCGEVLVITTDDPAAGWKSEESANLQAFQLRDRLPAYSYVYTWQVLPTQYGRWGFVFLLREGMQVEAVCLSRQDMTDYCQRVHHLKL